MVSINKHNAEFANENADLFRNSNGSDYNILASSFEDFKKKNIDIQTLLDKKLFESLDKNGEDSNDYEYAQDLLINQIPLYPDMKSEKKFETPILRGKESKSPIRSKTPNKTGFGDILKKNASEKTLPLSNKSNHEPLQVKFYYRGKKREENQRLLQQMIVADIKNISNSKKMSDNSYKLLIKRLEYTLTVILMEIDKENKKMLTFEQIGRMLTLLEIFRIIIYNQDFKLENKENFFSKDKKNQQRRHDEMIFHEQIWMMITPNASETFVSIELVYTLFRILMDPANLSLKEIAEILENYVTNFFHLKNYEEKRISMKNEEIESWTMIEFVKEYRKLSENRLAYLNIGYLKPEKFKEYKKKKEEDLTFTPILDPTSLYLDSKITSKFLEENHLKNNESNQALLDKNEIPEEENEDDLSSKLRKAESDNEKVSSLSRSRMASKFVDPHERVQILLKKHEITGKKLNEKKIISEKAKFKECTFTPKINSNKTEKIDEKILVDRLYDLHFHNKKAEAFKRGNDEKIRGELNECTFTPVLNTSSNTISHTSTENATPKGYEKFVGRLRFGFEEHTKKKEALEFVPAGENYENIIQQEIKPFSFVDKKTKHRKPFIYIDVNVSLGKTGRIGLCETDDVYEVARSFALAFQLSSEMEENLCEVLKEQKDNYLEKKKNKMNKK